MRRFQWLIYAWPGLPQLWQKGQISGLVSALVFTLVLNLGLITHWIWPGLLANPWKIAIWPVVAVVGIILVGWTFWSQLGKPQFNSKKEMGLFILAQEEYLRGSWTEAEALLRKLLQNNQEDIEARLLLVGICRRSGRIEEAKRQLRRLARLDEAEKWQLEMDRELQWMDNSPEMTDSIEQAEPKNEGGGQIPKAA